MTPEALGIAGVLFGFGTVALCFFLTLGVRFFSGKEPTMIEMKPSLPHFNPVTGEWEGYLAPPIDARNLHKEETTMTDEELKWKLLATYFDYMSRFGPQTGVPRTPKGEEYFPVNPDGLAAWNRIKELKAALNIAVEQDHLKNAERRLITEDVDINRIIQTHLEDGKWVLGSEGYLDTPPQIRRVLKGTDDAAS